MCSIGTVKPNKITCFPVIKIMIIIRPYTIAPVCLYNIKLPVDYYYMPTGINYHFVIEMIFEKLKILSSDFSSESHCFANIVLVSKMILQR